MGQEPSSQFEIAKYALEKLFLGNISFSYQDKARFQIVTSGTWQLEGYLDCLNYLSKETGPEKNIDPFKKADGNAWVIVSQVLSIAGLKSLALEVSLAYLDRCYSLQISVKKRIHKGAPLFWTSERSYENGDMQVAAGFMMLAFIEDVIIQKIPKGLPSYNRLIGLYSISPATLTHLTEYIDDLKRTENPEWPPFYPEEIIVGWEELLLPPLPDALDRGINK